jgi:hypothetical protein
MICLASASQTQETPCIADVNKLCERGAQVTGMFECLDQMQLRLLARWDVAVPLRMARGS